MVIDFPKQTPRAFTRADVLSVTPGQIGVYGLFKSGQWVYIGRGDIRAELLRYLNGENPNINLWGPTHWVDVVTADDVETEKRLILKYQPIANRKVG